jgi:DNA-binding response OmpR family regulator
MPPIRILFVDDEPALRMVTPVILQAHGFDATSVGTVADALADIAAHPFDVLISDLNIGQAGDGFTVVSAMRRTQPHCINFILTGYPAIEAALRTISTQVDEILVKPMDPTKMVAAIEQRLRERTPTEVYQTKRLSNILSDKRDEICHRVLVAMKGDPELSALPLSDDERLDHMRMRLKELANVLELATLPLSTQVVLKELANVLELAPLLLSDEERLDHTQIVLKELANVEATQLPPKPSLPAASKSGEERQRQQYPSALLAVNARLLQGVIYDIIHENLLSINLSYLMPDLKRLNEILALQAEEIIRTFLQVEKRAA